MPIAYLGLTLDGKVFPSNASKPEALALMLEWALRQDLIKSRKPVVIMDAGIASIGKITLVNRERLILSLPQSCNKL